MRHDFGSGACFVLVACVPYRGDVVFLARKNRVYHPRGTRRRQSPLGVLQDLFVCVCICPLRKTDNIGHVADTALQCPVNTFSPSLDISLTLPKRGRAYVHIEMVIQRGT